MGDGQLRDEISYWLTAARAWQCTCQASEDRLCAECTIVTSLDAAAESARQANWPGAHRAVMRAAAIDWRLDRLCAQLEDRASPYAEMEVAM